MRRRFMASKSFDENDYLTFVCLEDNSTIAFSKDIYYSINGGIWTKLYSNIPLRVISGMHISFKENFKEIDDMYGVGRFMSEGKFNILGNINSLIFGDNAKYQTDLSSYSGVFQNVFVRNTSIVDASLLKLPATTLAESCYRSMFNGCTSLTTAPALPATTLVGYCYSYMFSNCTNLITSPELPATTLASNCYSYMFSNCTNLITSPELPATRLIDNCYNAMFNGCSKLNYIKALFTTTPSPSYTSSWVSNVASSGIFVKNPEATWDVVGVAGVPKGWTVKFDGEEDGGIEFPVYLKFDVCEFDDLMFMTTCYSYGDYSQLKSYISDLCDIYGEEISSQKLSELGVQIYFDNKLIDSLYKDYTGGIYIITDDYYISVQDNRLYSEY